MDNTLTKDQAQAVLTAMMAIDKVGGVLNVKLPSPGGWVEVVETADGEIWVHGVIAGKGTRSDNYEGKFSFAKAYGVSYVTEGLQQ